MEGPDLSPGHSSVLSPARLDSAAGDPFLDELLPRLTHGVHWGLSRMEAFLRDTGDPHRSYPSVHLGGTNGKGSVASTVSAALERGGSTTGLYTSPHLCSFRERFQVAGHPVEEGELRELVRDLRDDIVRHELTFFEVATALALHLFQRRSVDVAVIEVGLGGRLDATNVVTPLITAITNVAKDHSEYLGETLSEIAREKAGIIKAGVPLLTGESDERILSVFEDVCDRMEAPFSPLRLDPEGMDLEITEDHTSFTVSTHVWGSLRVRTPLVGEHQAINGALSAAILGHLPESLRPDARTVLDGIESVCWPGRSQVVHLDGQTWLFDVAHNPAGAYALASVLERLALPRPVVLLTAVLGDKDWRSILPPLFARTDHAVFTQALSAPLERRWDPYAASLAVGRSETEIRTDFGEALERAKELAGSGTIIVTGSNHTVGDALGALDLSPF